MSLFKSLQFPRDLKAKLSEELDLQPSPEHHPPWSKKRWQRAKSTSSYPGVDMNVNGKEISEARRTKSVDEYARQCAASALSEAQKATQDVPTGQETDS